MRYRFDRFTLDLSTRLLSTDRGEIGLETKVFDLLALLIQRRDEVVAREVIAARLWPDVSVSDASISRLVKELRRALDDDGRRQRIIRTVRGVGFHFVAVVSPNFATATAEAETRPLREIDEQLVADIGSCVVTFRGELDRLLRAFEAAIEAQLRT